MVLTSVLLTSISYAQDTGFDQVITQFSRLTGSLDKLYQTHASYVDLLLYLAFFISVCQYALSHTQMGDTRQARVLGTVMGIILSIGMFVFMKNINKTLGDFGWIAYLILGLFITVIIARLLEHIFNLSGAYLYAAAFVFFYLFPWAIIKPYLFRSNIIDEAGIINSIASLLFLISIIALILALFGRWSFLGGESLINRAGNLLERRRARRHPGPSQPPRRSAQPLPQPEQPEGGEQGLEQGGERGRGRAASRAQSMVDRERPILEAIEHLNNNVNESLNNIISGVNEIEYYLNDIRTLSDELEHSLNSLEQAIHQQGGAS